FSTNLIIDWNDFVDHGNKSMVRMNCFFSGIHFRIGDLFSSLAYVILIHLVSFLVSFPAFAVQMLEIEL
ncbi:hypothetical protein PENTCL1PPCAC_10081, partial [Pristionchus entomophagus]